MNTKATSRTGGGTDGAEKRQPLPVPPGGWPRDAYTGHFGRFKRDPFTGVREPADEETRQAMQALGITSATEGMPSEPGEAPAAGLPADTTGTA